MVNRIKAWFKKDRNYLSDLKAKLRLTGSVSVPKNLISESEIYSEGFVYMLELQPKGYIGITEHKKVTNVVHFKVNY